MERSDAFNDKCFIRRMRYEETVRGFDCNDKDINSFISQTAPLYQRELLSVTYLMTPEKVPDKVLGYFSLANDTISLSSFSHQAEFYHFRRRQGFHNAKHLKSYPAVKVCRLGVDVSMKNLGMGSMLLDFIKTSLMSDLRSGCRFITVDSYIDAIPFYEKNGFRVLNSDDEKSETTRVLYFDLKKIV